GCEDAWPGCPGTEEALGHLVLMVGGKLMVRLDLLFRLGVDLLQLLAKDPGYVANADPAAGEGERVVHEHGEPPLGQLVGPADSPVVVLVVGLHHRMELIAELRDLPPAEILLSTMVMEPQHGGEPPARAGRLEEDGLRGRPVRELPAQVLDMQSVV